MFFREDEMLTFPTAKTHLDYVRYNELAKKIFANRLGKLSINGYHSKGEHTAFPVDTKMEFSFWRTRDKNIHAAERGVDPDRFTRTKVNGERVAYLIVPRMNTDSFDPHPYEYTAKKDSTFEDVMDPRTVVIARSYRGMVAEIAKDLVLDALRPFQIRYHYWNDPNYIDFANPGLMKMITECAIEMFAPNVLAELE